MGDKNKKDSELEAYHEKNTKVDGTSEYTCRGTEFSDVYKRQMFLRVYVNSENGDRVRVNLPLVLVKMARDMGLDIPQMTDNPMMQKIDLGMIMQLIESGVIGKLVEVDSANGDHVEVIVE